MLVFRADEDIKGFFAWVLIAFKKNLQYARHIWPLNFRCNFFQNFEVMTTFLIELRIDKNPNDIKSVRLASISESTSDVFFFYICFCNYHKKNNDQLFKSYIYYILTFSRVLSQSKHANRKQGSHTLSVPVSSNGGVDIFLCYYSPILCSDNNVKR